jgi:hypothetical protein
MSQKFSVIVSQYLFTYLFKETTVRSKIKKIEMAMINTLQLAARKN